jgi:hypothetical protein
MAELVYCSGLLNRRGLKSTVSSNLTSSAIFNIPSWPSGKATVFGTVIPRSTRGEGDFLNYFFDF